MLHLYAPDERRICLVMYTNRGTSSSVLVLHVTAWYACTIMTYLLRLGCFLGILNNYVLKIVRDQFSRLRAASAPTQLGLQIYAW